MQQNIKSQRINVVDSLRGFAVVGIIIIHFLEHLNFYAFPEPTPFDEGLWDTVFPMPRWACCSSHWSRQPTRC